MQYLSKLTPFVPFALYTDDGLTCHATQPNCFFSNNSTDTFAGLDGLDGNAVTFTFSYLSTH